MAGTGARALPKDMMVFEQKLTVRPRALSEEEISSNPPFFNPVSDLFLSTAFER